MEKVDYYGIQLHLLNTSSTLDTCKDFLQSGNNNLIFFINAHCYNIAQKRDDYKSALNKADLILNDGIGIKLGLRFMGKEPKENMNGTDFIPHLMQFARDHRQNVYLLGGEQGVSEKAKQKLIERFEGISIVGERNGFFDFDDPAIIQDIIAKKTDILVVGMGVPRQELWLTTYKNELQNVKISIAGGAVLDFISGKVLRAPKWMQKTGTEWVFRLLQEPVRLFNRYFIGIPVFFYYIWRFRN